MTEREQALKLAARILDRYGVDPDDDLGILARQLTRAHERAEKLHAALEALRRAVEKVPEMQNRDKYLSLGMQVNAALGR
jgi:broad specificity phosphatase PhoE